MAKSNKTLNAEINAKKGVDIPSVYSGRPCMWDITNFRILGNGSLKKRSGFRHCYTHPSSPVKALWSGKVGGIFRCYILFGSDLCEFNFLGNNTRHVGTIPETTDAPCIFHHKNAVFINSSSGFYKVEPTPTKITGYVPLYGKDWGTTYPGEIYQPLNLLNRTARISYVATEKDLSAMLSTKYHATSVISVYKNGSLLPKSAYYYDHDYNTINMNSGIYPGDRFVATVEFGDHITDEYSAFLSTNRAATVGEMTKSRIFAWGGMHKNRLFVSSAVSAEDLSESMSAVPESNDLYFSESNSFFVGDGQNDITAVTQHYDRILIFTNGDVWMANADISDGEFPTMSINSTAGCSSSECVVRAGNSPVSIGQSAILRWTSATDERNECNAKSISDRISEALPQSFFKNGIAFHDIYKDELWFTERYGDGTVWIYSVSADRWFAFTGVTADGFFDANGNVAFYNGNSLFIFDEGLKDDLLTNYGTTRQIEAFFRTGNLDFETANPKRLTEIELKFFSDGDPIYVFIITDKDEMAGVSTKSASGHTIMKQRLRSGRFSFVNAVVLATGGASQMIHSLTLNAKEKL